MNEQSKFIYRDTAASRIARLNAVVFNKQLNADTKDSLYQTRLDFLKDDDPYKFTEEPYKRLADDILNKRHGDNIAAMYEEVMSWSATSSFDDQLQGLFQSSNRVLKNVFNSTFTEEFLGEDKDVFDTGRNSLFRNVFERATNSSTTVSDNYSFSSAFEAPLSELVNRDLVAGVVDHGRVTAELDYLNRQYELDETMKYLGTGYLEDYLGDANGTSRTRALFEKIDYITKPGVLPAVGLIEGANNELYIDMYQLQNPVVRNFITTKLIQRINSSDSRDNNFKLVVRMTSPIENFGSGSDTAYNILGPNLLFAEALGAIQRGMTEEERAKVDISVRWANKRSHSKYILTDSSSYIGTANITEPMGTSVRQAGSNYENVRLLHFRHRFASDADKKTFLEQFDEQAKVHASYNEVVQWMQDQSTLPYDQIDSSSKLYLQSRYLKRHFEEGVNRMPLDTGAPNIGGPLQTYKHLKKTIEAVQNARTGGQNAIFYGVLNQVFLLDYVAPDLSDPFTNKELNNQIAGEMGLDSATELSQWRAELSQKALTYREQIQKPLFNLLIEGGAQVIVDPHNYQEKLINPLYEQLLKKKAFKDNKYDIKRMLRRVEGDTPQAKISSLTATLGDEHLARVTLALFSGNVHVATVPFLHSKMYGGYLFKDNYTESELADLKAAMSRNGGGSIELLGAKQGSSNLGLRSTSVRDSAVERESTNSELDLLLYGASQIQESAVKGGLSRDEQSEEELMFTRMLVKTLGETSRLRFGQLNYTNVDQQELHRKNIDRMKVEELYDSLHKLSQEAAYGLDKPFKVYREFDDIGVKEVIVDIKNGPNLRFSVVGDDVSNGGRYSVLAVDQGRLINRIAVTNMSNVDVTFGVAETDDLPDTPLKLGSKQKAFIDPIQATISLVATMTLERDQIKYVKGPLDYINSLNMTDVINVDSHHTATQTAAVINFLSNSLGLNLDAYRLPGRDDLIDVDALRRSPALIKKAQSRLDKFLFDFATSSSTYSTIRDIAGIDLDSKERQNAISNYVNSVHDWLHNPTDNKLSVVVGSVIQMLSSDEFTDFRYAFANGLDDYRNSTEVKKRLKEVQEKLFEPFLLSTQQRVYSTSQSYHQMPLFGIAEEAAYISNIFNSANTLSRKQGYHHLKSRAIMAVPFAFGPSMYLGEGPDTFVKVAEGGGARFFMNNPYGDQFLPFVRVSQGKTGTVYDPYIIDEARVGIMIDQQKMEAYLASLNPAVRQMLEEQEPEMLTNIREKRMTYVAVNFKSLDQTAQRLKNALGSRPMLNVSMRYQQFLEAGGNYETDVVEQYLKTEFSDNARDKVRQIEGERVQYAAMFSGAVATFLAPKAMLIAKQIERDIRDEYELEGFTEDEINALIPELLRMRAINNELFGVTKGLITAAPINDNKNVPVMLIALGGGFSDFGYGNPFYGHDAQSYDPVTGKPVNPWDKTKVWGGPRSAWLDQATKSVKASLMAADFTELAETGLVSVTNAKQNLLQQGDRMLYDYDQGVAIVLDTQGNTKRVINSRSELNVIGNAIEKAGSSSVGIVTASSNALTVLGEEGVEHVFRQSFLQGATSSNEVRSHIGYVRSVLGAYRRIDAAGGGLNKAPMLPGGFGLFNLIYDQLPDKMNVTKEQIFGLFSMSNVKAYLYEHGSTLLTTKADEYMKLVDQRSSSMLAAALLIGVNSKHFDHLDRARLDAVYEKLYTQASKGLLGDYMKGATVINEQLGDSSFLRGRAFFENFTPRDDYNPLSAFKLKQIDIKHLEAAVGIRGNSIDVNASDLRDILKAITLGQGSGSFDQQYLGQNTPNNDYISLRERAYIAGQLDVMMQLMEPVYVKGVPLAPSMSTADRLKHPVAKTAYTSLAAIAEADDLGSGDNPDPLTGAVLEAMMNNFQVIRIFGGNTPGQTKPPTSKKKTGNIEMQEILANNFNKNAEVFRAKGRLDNMRKVVTTLYGMMTNLSQYEFTGAYNIEALNLVDMSLSHLDDPHEKRAGASRVMNQILGYYASPNIKQTSLVKTAKSLHMFSFLDWDKVSRAHLIDLITKITEDPQIQSRKAGDPNDGVAAKRKLLRALDDVKTIHTEEEAVRFLRHRVTDIYFDTINSLQVTAHHYDHSPNKPLGIERGESIVSSLIAQGFQTTAYSFPSLSFQGTPTGRVKVTADYNNSQMGIFLDPKAVRALGEQFAGFQSDLAKAAIALYEALTPDSLVFTAFRKIQKAEMSTDPQNRQLVAAYLNESEAAQLQQFQQATEHFLQLANEELSGRYVQEILGNKVRAPGSTTVSGASLFLFGSEGVVPAAINNRFKVVNANDPRYKLASLFMDEYSRINGDKAFAGDKMARKYLLSGVDMLLKGMSNQKEVIEAFRTQSNVIRNQILQSINSSGIDDRVFTEISHNIKRLEKMRKSFDFQGEGNQFLETLFKLEQEHLTALAKRGHISMTKSLNVSKNAEQLRQINQKIKNLESLPTIFSGFLGTPSTKEGLMSEQLEGKLGSAELHKNVLINLKAIKKDRTRLIQFIDQLKYGVETGIKDIAEKLQIATDEQKNAFNAVLRDKDEMLERLNRYKKDFDTFNGSELTKRLELDLVTYISKMNSGIVNVKRSPPPGFLHMAVTGNIVVTNLELLNKRIVELSEEAGVNAVSADFDFFAESTGAGRSIGLFHPISYLAPNLGDFDGDAMTVIFSNITEIEVLVASQQEKVYRINQLIAEQHRKPKKNGELSPLHKRQLDKLQGIRRTLIDQLHTHRRRITHLKKQEKYSNFESTLKKWVADYAQLDEEFVNQFDMRTTLTFVTQVKGLYPNMEAAMTKVKNVHSSYITAVQQFKNQKDQTDLVSFLKDKDGAEDSLLPAKMTLEYLDAVDSGLINELQQAGTDENLVNKALGKMIARVAHDQLAQKNIKKLTQLGESRIADMPTFDVMNKVLGKAGSVLLGKMYNNTINVLYQQSPLLALGAAVENDSHFRNIIFAEMRRYDKGQSKASWVPQFREKIQVSKDMDANAVMATLEKHARDGRRKVERLGGFIQEIHQMLRDSIKAKEGLGGFEEKIKAQMDNYAAATDEAGRDKVLTELSKELEVEPLYRFDRFMASMDTVNKAIKDHQRYTMESDLTEEVNVGEQYFNALSDILNVNVDEAKHVYTQFTQLVTSHLPRDEKGHTLLDRLKRKGVEEGALVASYEVKKGLVNATAAFAFTNTMKSNSVMHRRFEELMLKGVTPERAAHLQSLVQYASYPTQEEATLEKIEFQQFVETHLPELLESTQDPTNRNKLLASAMEFSKARNNVNEFFGEYGQKLFDLYDINKVRSDLASQQEGLSRLGYNPAEDQLLGLVYSGMQTGKINTSEALSRVFMGLATLHNSAGDGTTSSMLTKMIANLSEGLAVDVSLDGDVDLIGAIMSVVSADENSANALLDGVRATSLGNIADTTLAFVNSVRNSVYDKSKAATMNAAQVTASISNIEKEQQYLQNQLTEVFGADMAKKMTHMFLNQVHPDFYESESQTEIENKINEYVEKNNRNNKDDLIYKMFLEEGRNVSVLAEVGLFPMLALVGNLIASGDPTGEEVSQMVHQTVGNALMAYSYNHSSNSALGQMLGAGFKVRMVTSGQENPVMQVLNLVTQEAIGIAGYEQLDKITNSIGKMLKMDEVFRDFRRSPIDVEMNQGLKLGFEDIAKSTLAGAAHMVVSSVINKVFNLGQSKEDKYREAIEKSIQTESQEEQLLNDVIQQYNQSSQEDTVSYVEEDTEIIDGDNVALDYEMQQQYVAHYTNVEDSYQSVDEGFEMVIGNYQPDMLALSA